MTGLRSLATSPLTAITGDYQVCVPLVALHRLRLDDAKSAVVEHGFQQDLALHPADELPGYARRQRSDYRAFLHGAPHELIGTMRLPHEMMGVIPAPRVSGLVSRPADQIRNQLDVI